MHQGNRRRVLSGRTRQAPWGDQGREGRCADCVTTLPEGRMVMQVKTRVKAGGGSLNHNETLGRAKGQAKELTGKACVKAGGIKFNHAETLVQATPQQRTRV